MENLLKEKNLFWIKLLNEKKEFNRCLYERTWKLGLFITKTEKILYNENKELKNENKELKNENKELKNKNEELKKIISKILNKSIIELFNEKEKVILNNSITGKKRKNNFDE